jgi:hypothetical protein
MNNFTAVSTWQKLMGGWRGRQRVYQTPDELSGEGNMELEIRARLAGKALELAYSYSLENIEYQGLILIAKPSEQKYEAAWTDGYHTSGGFMKFEGTDNGPALVLEGGYHYGEEFWGWTIELIADGDQVKIQHFNRPPGGERYLGVDISLERNT